MSESDIQLPESTTSNGDSLFSEQISSAPVVESTNSNGEEGSPESSEAYEAQPSNEEFGKSMITIRSLVTSKEAGAIIGKNGKNVADLRDETGVKAGVSKPVRGVQDRVLTITGTLDGVAKAYSMAAQTLVENPSNLPYIHGLSPPSPPGVTTVRLLIPHQQMGSVIGRQGLKIKTIQESAHVRMVASKEMLAQSTERVVEIQGAPESLKSAVWEVGKCLLDDWERAAGSILYTPHARPRGEGPLDAPISSNRTGGAGFASNGGYNGNRYNGRNYNSSSNNNNNSNNSHSNKNQSNDDEEDDSDYQDQEISIPADMVGCIIGKGGSKIQEIRKESGARISIAKEAIDETGQRLFTIRGTAQANEKALYLLYEQLESEKSRRSEEN